MAIIGNIPYFQTNPYVLMNLFHWAASRCFKCPPKGATVVRCKFTADMEHLVLAKQPTPFQKCHSQGHPRTMMTMQNLLANLFSPVTVRTWAQTSTYCWSWNHNLCAQQEDVPACNIFRTPLWNPLESSKYEYLMPLESRGLILIECLEVEGVTGWSGGFSTWPIKLNR